LIFHAYSSAITSYGIAKKNVLPYYLLSASLQGTNNFFAAISASFLAGVVGLLVLVVVYWFAWWVWHRASRDRVVS